MDPQKKEGVWLSCVTLSPSRLREQEKEEKLFVNHWLIFWPRVAFAFIWLIKEIMLHMGLLESLMSQSSSLERTSVALSVCILAQQTRPGCRVCLLGHKTGYCCTRGLLYSLFTLHSNCWGIPRVLPSMDRCRDFSFGVPGWGLPILVRLQHYGGLWMDDWDGVAFWLLGLKVH